jgi:hypothetical protein
LMAREAIFNGTGFGDPKEGGMRRFKYDVFVSYSHLDDLSPSDERGWVSTFIDNLKNQLTQRLGRRASVWYDNSMTGERVFNETIKSAIKDSGVLVAICSASYRQSEWCTREREWFAREGLTVGDQRRLLQVRLISTPHEQWPEEFQGCAGFDFFSLRDFDQLGSPLDPTDPAFKEELRKIVVAIQSLLETLESIQALPDNALQLANVTGSSGKVTATTSLSEYSESCEFNVLKQAFMIDFKKCFSQIQLLSGRKDLHDQLHELQFRFLTPVSAIFADKSISIDHQLQSILRLYCSNLSEIHENLAEIVLNNRVIPVRELTWIEDLEKAYADFDEGIRRIDLAQMLAAIASVETILARWPSRINTQLTETARDLSLVELVRKLQLLCDKSTTFKQLLGDKAWELERSASSIPTLAAIHDDWQMFDEDLRLTITQSLRDIEVIWPGLRDKAANLCVVNPGNWTQRIKRLSGEIDLAIQARNLDLAKGHFIRFTSAARDRFYLADQDLKNGCSMLQQISAPIEEILSAPS